jgi:hypothetical protein
MPGLSGTRVRAAVIGAALVAALAFTAFPAGASPRVSGGAVMGVGVHGTDPLGPDEISAYGYARTAPALTVSGQALASAEQQSAQLPTVGGSWTELTNNSDNLQPSGYNDPVWSNVGAGFRNTSGRVTALAAQGSTLYMGAAAGGVWKSTDNGQNWVPIGDKLPTLSIGALAVNPADNSLWVGLGEANTNADSYAGQGVVRSATGDSSFSRVGGDELSGFTIYKVLFDGAGHVYAATNHGLWRRSAGDLTSAWTLVFQPDPNPTNNPYHTGFITDVQVAPGSGGATVLAADGWRGAGVAGDTAYNGFYVSTTGGTAGSFNQVTPSGAINASDIGRTTFAYSTDGSKLYAVVESPSKLVAGRSTNLQGVFLSTSGPAGPWTLIANASKLCGSGSACPTFGNVGVQTWYNEYLTVDPANANHVILGLEETYQSFDAGATWTTINPYWNYNFACDQTNPPTCAPVTHPDQHAVAIVGGTLYIGNDGGVYSRPLEDTAANGDWTDLNDTLHTLQYYDAEAGAQGHGHQTMAVWGGLQDNGTTVSFQGAAQTITPAGGDGGGVIVNPDNSQDAVGEYVDLNTYLTTDGGHTFSTISPACAQALGQPITGCDPGPRFIAPLATDVKDPNHWVIGGEFVWNDTAAWSTVCHAADPTTTPPTPQQCSWQNVHDTGRGHSITALAVNGSTIYAAWCGGGCNTGGATPFSSGIDTNYGGTWHTIAASNLPNRFIQGLTVDHAHPGHVFAIFNGYSRRWIPGGGVGHVFESSDGGTTFTDISGNLPDVPSDALVYARGELALATDIGAFVADAGNGSGTTWSRLGSNLPNTSINNLRLNPDGKTLLAATHGRGIWSVPIP